ncbi:condensation domain-containing protein [Streptomyces mirabilis]|uniref:condensation domain-containing protein n=1 Tax=Streptomyces mirabilis TaxID=68239 RepID=UPI0021BEF298|nr:condensation domain-containing protein [Streptomyces mirabilis]MCT9110120.1 condensation domain-containing protein [Streptomyces mirabilis]
MLTPTPLEELLDLAADVIGRDRRTLPAGAAGSPFITLGGGLAQAVRLQARAGRQLGLAVDLAQLLGPAPLADVLARAVPVPAAVPGPPSGAGAVRALLPGQRAALAAERAAGAGAVCRVLSAELAGPLDAGALRRVLAALGARHEGLRTVFADAPHGPVRRVLAACTPPLVTLEAAGAGGGGGGDPVAAVHGYLAARARQLVGRPGRPPLVFALSRLAGGAHLLSFVYHDAVADSWSAALLWQELLADYDRAVHRRPLVRGLRPGPDTAGRAAVAARPGGLRAAGERAERLRGFPAAVDLAEGAPRPAVFDVRGERLHVGLDVRLRDAADATARRAGVPHATVLLAAWALAVGRRAGLERLLVGCEVPRRATAALLGTLAPCSATVPVGCELEGGVDYFLRGVACAFSEALGCADLDTAELARELGVRPDRSRPVLTPVTFAARDELLPARAWAGALSARFHHGHAGAVTADAALTVLRWREDPLLRLEFAPAVLSRTRAVRLAGELRTTLAALTAASPHTPVEDLLPAPAGARGLALPLP